MKGYLAITLAALCLSFIGIFTNFIGDNIPSISLNFLRLVFATITLAAIMPFLDKSFLRIRKKDLPYLLLIGILTAINFTMFITSFTFVPIANVVIIVALYPLFLIPFSWLILREKTSKRELLSILLAILALIIINPLAPGQYFGNLLALISAIMFALLVAYMRYEDRDHNIGVVFWFMFFATLFLSPSAFVYGFGDLIGNIHWIVLLGVVSTALAYLFFNYALKKLRAERVAIIDITLTPLFAIIFGIFLLGQIPTINIVIGGVILIVSSAIVQWHRKRGIRKGHTPKH